MYSMSPVVPEFHLHFNIGNVNRHKYQCSDASGTVQVMDDIDQVEIVKILLQMGDLKDLGNVALLDLANVAQIENLTEGHRLSAEQQLDRHLYLMVGEIELSVNGKNMQHIVAGSERALMPLFRIHTRGLVAKCLTPVRLLSLNEDIVKRYVASIRPPEGDGIRVVEYSEVNQEASIIAEMRQIFHHNEVDLPSLPEIALRIDRAVNDPNQPLRGLAFEIQADPMIAARVIQVANSALYTPAIHIESIQDAVSRIGLKALQTIVKSVVMRNLFKPKSDHVQKRAIAFCSHSIQVGAICYTLARHMRHFSQDQAFLAGLLHDVGVMPILILADKRADLATNPELLEIVIQSLTGQTGKILLQQWGFSDELQTAAKEAQDWQRQKDTADYCDLVQIAQLHCHLIGGSNEDAPPMNELPAFRRLQLEGIDPVRVIQNAHDEIYEIVNLLTATKI